MSERGFASGRGLAPSVISADPMRFRELLLSVEPFAARWHVDVMDGHYVPNLTLGPAHVEAIARASKLPQDVHLMVTNPDDTWEWYAKAGAARIAFHPGASTDPRELLRRIAGAGIGAGLAVNPEVAARDINANLDLVDHLVVMSVHPGFSGQRFIPEVLPKVVELRSLLGGRDVQLVVDGGVNPDTAPRCAAAGADILVSASAIFLADDPPAVARQLRHVATSR